MILKIDSMKKSLFTYSLLLAGVFSNTSCSNNEDSIIEAPPPLSQEWTAYVNAAADSIGVGDDVTRAYFYGGNTRRYYTLWDENDVVRVYKGSEQVGTVAPPSSSWGNYRATLTGTLTGPFAVNDVFGLYMPTRSMDFTGQKGTVNDLSAHYAFQYATTTVAEAANSILSLGNVGMSHRSIYLRFQLQDAATGARLHPSVLVISAISGDIVLTMDEEGNATTGDLTITPELDTGEYPGEIFVSLLNSTNTSVTYRLKATVGSDVYVGPTDRAMSFNPRNYIGVLNRVARTMTKTKPVATTLAITAIPDKVFTGSAHEPVLEVKDGETTLTLDADYSVAYTDNVNAGTATATITGLAESGATCTTPYLGTQDKTFNIVQAVPVITMPTTVDMTLEVGLTRNRAVTSVTLDNSAYGIADLDIMAAPYNCTVTYTSDDESVASVAADGTVTGVATGTTTIHVNVASAANWTSQTTSYVVKVSPRVNTSGNASWTVTEDAEDGNLYQ